MILATVLALPGIGLVAGGTPRQASALFGDRMHETGRRLLRLAGFTLLCASLWFALIDADRARHFIDWVGTIGIEACGVAFALTIRGQSHRT